MNFIIVRHFHLVKKICVNDGTSLYFRYHGCWFLVYFHFKIITQYSCHRKIPSLEVKLYSNDNKGFTVLWHIHSLYPDLPIKKLKKNCRVVGFLGRFELQKLEMFCDSSLANWFSKRRQIYYAQAWPMCKNCGLYIFQILHFTCVIWLLCSTNKQTVYDISKDEHLPWKKYSTRKHLCYGRNRSNWKILWPVSLKRYHNRV